MKKTTVLLLTLGSLAVLNFSSCIRDNFCIEGNGNTKERIETVSDFDEIKLSASFNVVVSEGPQEVRVVGDGNIIDDVRLNVVSNQLTLDMKNGCFNNFDITVHVTTPDLSKVKINGSGDILIQEFDNQQDLQLIINGSGDITVNEFAGLDDLTIEVRGSGDIHFDDAIDNVAKADYKIEGSGSINAFNVAADDCSVDVDGSGDCELTAELDLDVRISGSGDVKFKGNPNIKQNIDGSGRLINRN